MPLTGFYFIQMFFVSSNIAANNMLQIAKPKKKKEKANADWGNYQIYWDDVEDNQATEDDDDKETPYFKVFCDPVDLQHLDIIWQIVLKSEVEEVYKPAVSLLVYSHLSSENSKSSEVNRSI